VVWEVEQERLLEQLSLLLSWEIEHGHNFLPAAFEVQFGIEPPDAASTILPAGVVQFGLDNGGTIHLRGRIDRIDISSDGRRARILDYKSGKPVRGRFMGGSALQLPLYLYAARHLRSDLQWVAADYVYINRAAHPRQAIFTDETWAETESDLRTLVTTLVNGMRAGCFPQTPSTCQPCAFPLVCSTTAATRAARKHRDPRLDTLLSLRNIP
jgi:ATP-dependent helicase/DNAse subunit B